MAAAPDQGRRLRPKERKMYTDEDLDDDEIEGKRNFSLEDKLKTHKYNGSFVKHLKGNEVTMKYFQENGFTSPILVRDKAGLGMRVPSSNFSVTDVKLCVGSRRMLDVMDVNTQKALEMSMKDWVNYYQNQERERLLNVISLEFSHTRLENYVEQPLVVRQLDWVETVWPRHLKDCQTEATNILEKMRYPKVQKYCLMSVAGCYTDFHVDMGGTSVWYHILQGAKIFWLIPPTERNLELYENWVKSGKQGDVFFGDTVECCQRIRLEPGITFFIPTGWIHAVYTPEDSLVFGGNFLHNFNIPMQLRVMEVEDRTHVPAKFRFPFAGELHWYLLERYVSVLLGKHFRQKSEEEIKEEQEEKEDKLSYQNTSSPPDTNDDRSNDSKDSDLSATVRLRRLRRRSDDYSSQGEDSMTGSPMSEDHNYTSSPKPLFPKSPHSPAPPISPNSPKKVGDENSTPQYGASDVRQCRSRGSRPCSPATISLKGDQSASRSYRRRKSHSDEEMDKKKSTADLGKVRLFNPLDQIRPVSVKLENCMNMLDGAGVVVHKTWVHLTQWELEGLRALVKKLEELPPTKRCIPKDIPDWLSLLAEFKKLLEDHRGDDHRLAATGELILKWPPRKEKRKRITEYGGGHRKPSSGQKVVKQGGAGSSSIRRRRVRCKKCAACTRTDCGECNFCKDMKKYGGPGRMKQSCVSRQCLQPVLPHSAVCLICDKDEPEDEGKTNLMECGICWEIVHMQCLKDKNPAISNDGVTNEDLPNSWECPKCCDDGKQGQLKPRVLKGGLKRTGSRQSSTSSELSEDSKIKVENELEPSRRSQRVIVDEKPTPSDGEDKSFNTGMRGRSRKARDSSEEREPSPRKKIKVEDDACSSPKLRETRSGRSTPQQKPPQFPHRHTSSPLKVVPGAATRVTSRGRETDSARGQPKRSGSSTPVNPRSRSPQPGPSQDIQDVQEFQEEGEEGLGEKRRDPNLSKLPYPLKHLKIALQRYIVRPAPIAAPPKCMETEAGFAHALDQTIWMMVFHYLPQQHLCKCLRVCKTWNRWAMHQRLWRSMNLNRRRITQEMLIGLVKRQPIRLDLSWTNISRRQLGWLVARLPQLRHLVLSGVSWAAVCGLCSSSCPLLRSLNIDWVNGIRDNCVIDLVTPPTDHRPGVDDSTSRLHYLVELDLAGNDITDSALKGAIKYLPRLESLNLSYCTNLTDAGIATLTANLNIQNNLKELDLAGCNHLTDLCLHYLEQLKSLKRFSVIACPAITSYGCSSFLAHTTDQGFVLLEEGRFEVRSAANVA